MSLLLLPLLLAGSSGDGSTAPDIAATAAAPPPVVEMLQPTGLPTAAVRAGRLAPGDRPVLATTSEVEMSLPAAAAIEEQPAGDSRPPVPDAPVYTVQQGDTLFEIALRYGVPMALLMERNGILSPQRIHPGFVLQIPAVPLSRSREVSGEALGTVSTFLPGESLAEMADRLGLDAAALARYNDLPPTLQLDDGLLLIVPPAPAAHAALRVDPDLRQLPVVPAVAPGAVYTVRDGDSLGVIATAHHLSTDTLRAANGLPSERIFTGQKLTIPALDNDALLALTPFLWPVTNHRPIQWYWWAHQAIDLLLPVGSPVSAAAGGTVEVAGWHNYGYGYHVVIDHGNGVKTLYAHLSDLNVTAGQLVARGELIAFSGHTGHSTHPHLHFEILANRRLLNPCVYLESGCG